MARSNPFKKLSYVKFVNCSSRRVVLKWVISDGCDEVILVLNPNQSKDVGTIESIAWICEDTATKTKLLINKSSVFYATPDKIEHAYITLPVLSLFRLSTEVVIRAVQSKEDVMSLNIPAPLQLSIIDNGCFRK